MFRPVIEKKVIDGVTYYRLYGTCPTCTDISSRTRPSYWKHDMDSGDIYLGSNGCLFCSVCGRIEHISKCDFSCVLCSKSKQNVVHFSTHSSHNVDYDFHFIGEIFEVEGLSFLQELLQNL